VREVTDATFEQAVLRADSPVVVDFWAPWCKPCHAIAPILEELEQETAGRVAFVKVDVDANPNVASQHGVLSLPTVILFENGEPQHTVIGARPRSHFVESWSRWLRPEVLPAG
jgi:thioredoxin 1